MLGLICLVIRGIICTGYHNHARGRCRTWLERSKIVTMNLSPAELEFLNNHISSGKQEACGVSVLETVSYFIHQSLKLTFSAAVLLEEKLFLISPFPESWIFWSYNLGYGSAYQALTGAKCLRTELDTYGWFDEYFNPNSHRGNPKRYTRRAEQFYSSWVLHYVKPPLLLKVWWKL